MTRLLCLCIFFLPLLTSGQSQKRVALVIGAQNYVHLPKLHNSLNDAQALSAALKTKGFDVETLLDPNTKSEIKDAVTRYFTKMRNQTGAAGIIFYAGHGMQFEGENYLIPVAATLDNPGDLDENCVKMNTVMMVLQSTSKSLNILMLDACRSLPAFTRGNETGLSRMEPPEGSIIVFATQPGKVASDGQGTNGLFTSNLLQAIGEPQLNLPDVLKKVQRQVFEESNQRQLPSIVDNSTGGEFYFTSDAKQTSAKPATVAAAQTGSTVHRSTTYNDAAKKEAARQQKASSHVTTSPRTKRAPAQKEVKKTKVDPVDFGYGPTTTALIIGNQVWAPVNLNVDRFATGAPIQKSQDMQAWTNSTKKMQPAWSFQEADSSVNGSGRLYNWYAVIDPRGLCPAGWHVPSKEEFEELTKPYGDSSAIALKADDYWGRSLNGEPGMGIDLVGFAAVPTGRRLLVGSFEPMPDVHGWLWTSTLDTEMPMMKLVWSVAFFSYMNEAFYSEIPIDYGLGVRCLKD